MFYKKIVSENSAFYNTLSTFQNLIFDDFINMLQACIFH